MSTERLPPRFAQGLRHFNAGEFFEAHEVFENLLDDVDDARWDLLVALVQVAVGYHKWAGGHPGAARMLRLGAGKLAAFPATAYGVAVGALREQATADASTLETGGTLGAPPRIAMGR
jgi:hypothetical protein